MPKKTAAPFWMVWNPDGRQPRFRHDNQQLAVAEAERLARANPGQEFYVLEPTHRVVSNDIIVEQYDRDDIPF